MITRSIRIDRKSYQISSDDDYLAQMSPVFEPKMVDLFCALITPEMTVADIGANIGLTSILFSDLAKKVYAFEPSPSTFEILKTNLHAASADNVEAFNIGMGQSREDMTLTFSNQNRSGGFVSQHIKPEKGHTTEIIKIDTLDGFFAYRDYQPNRPDFIKMDVEGFEPHVIRGGQNLFAASKATTVLELNHFCLNVLQRITLPDFFDLLRRVFPLVFAISADNKNIANLHNSDQAYSVMHGHVTQFAYPNIVAGFDPAVADKLARFNEKARATQ